MYAEEARPSPLVTLVPIVTVLGLTVFLIYSVTGGTEEAGFYQIGVGVALVAYFLTFVDIIVGLAILIACVSLSPEFTIGGVGNIRLEDFIVPALVVAWVTRAVHQRQPLIPSGLRAPLLFYFGAMVLSTLIGLAAGTTKPLTAALRLLKNAEYFALLLIILNNVRTERHFRALAVFTLLSSLAGSFISMFVLSQSQRVHGPPGEFANIFGGYLTLHLALAVGLYLHSPSLPGRLATASLITFLGIALVFTYSRTSYAAFTLAVGVFAFWKDRRLLVILLFMIILFLAMAPDPVLSRAAGIPAIVTEGGPPSWLARTDAWVTAMARLLKGNPVFGFGMGSVSLGDVDNEYVRVLVDTGFLGLALFLWLIIRILRRANAAYLALPAGTFHKGYAAGFLMGWLALAVHGIGATSFTAIRTMETFMIMSGLTLALAANLKDWGLGVAPGPGPLAPAEGMQASGLSAGAGGRRPGA